VALSDKNIVITPNISQTSDPQIVFSGADASTGPQNITLRMYPTNSGTLSFEGSAGQLFSINNSTTGTIFSANDVSGIPSIEVLDTGLVKLAQYGGNVLIGTGTDNASARLQVNGAISSSSTVTGTQLISSVSTGTSPLVVTSTTQVNNLNAQYWQGNTFSTYLNQSVRTDSSPTFGNIYSNNWFRNYNENGLYNETHGNHWYATSNTFWNIAANNTAEAGIIFRTGGHQGTVRGYIFATSSNEIGFLNTSGSWTLRVDSGGTTYGTFSGSLSGNASTAYGLSVHTGRNNEANKVVRTDGSGYAQFGWINTDSGDYGTNAINRIYASGDGYIRYYTPANFLTVMNISTFAKAFVLAG